MEKMKSFAFQSLVALAGVFAFTACSSSDEASVDPNPTYDGQSVKTQFTISLPDNITTRMAASEVQYTGSAFRGIDQIQLVPYSVVVAEDASANANLISLSPITAFDATESHSKVYADVSLAVGTSNFLFYGKAVDNTASDPITTAADKFKFGTLSVANLSGKPTLANVEFTPVGIYADATDAGKAVGTNLIAALNAVADATPTADLTTGTVRPKFKEVTEAQSATIKALWDKFASITTGSSKNIEWAFKELYMNLDGSVTTVAQSTAPNTYYMAKAIREALDTYVEATINSGGVTTAVVLKDAYKGYPGNVNLPDGAARVTYNTSTGAFVAATSVDYASTMNVAALASYVYPANLQYFVNSPVKVSDNVQSPSYGTKTWTEILDLYSGSAVTDATRSVAITNQVQYGVARLDAQVNGLVATSAEQPKYYDYAGKEVDVTNGFQLTGILVGGQKSVGWNYLPKGTTAFTIYDKAMNGTASTMTVKREQATATNYTLVLQTGDEAADKSVNIALEFINMGADFVGADGEIIPAGATFYLVGTLDKTAATNKDETAVAAAKDRVFTQDFNTIATFSIKQGTATAGNNNGLGTATKGLPDLRVPVMELGLSVNLEWQPGLTFDINI